MQLVNEEKFFSWYASVCRQPDVSRSSVLDDLMRQYHETRSEEFVLPASQSVSGLEEHYPFRYENIGCCGASTPYLYF